VRTQRQEVPGRAPTIWRAGSGIHHQVPQRGAGERSLLAVPADRNNRSRSRPDLEPQARSTAERAPSGAPTADPPTRAVPSVLRSPRRIATTGVQAAGHPDPHERICDGPPPLRCPGCRRCHLLEIRVRLPGEHRATLHSCSVCGCTWWDVDGGVVAPAVVHRLVPKSTSPTATWRRATQPR
jgi:hypothetical protein